MVCCVLRLTELMLKHGLMSVRGEWIVASRKALAINRKPSEMNRKDKVTCRKPPEVSRKDKVACRKVAVVSQKPTVTSRKGVGGGIIAGFRNLMMGIGRR